ncbi:hypothetical protein Verru16b_00309 [Lacunisphaera limnophila]|uniref:Uncharacterized protein n=1 Tax=Lacunisphaera limnophila TaxID=1838286 RepID=A0A1I7PI13_9BACT|nr:hypothetical protein [Lacunisphaera limnophila]AOS43266.1 hypothetical protein Verru16b_00309 [Lacunisphaera limnophila]
MSFFDALRPSRSTPGGPAAKLDAKADPIFAVPIATRKLTPAGVASKATYIYYAFLFADSADDAVARVRREVRDEGYEFLQLTGPVLTTSLPAWTDFVANRFDWMKESLPTTQQLNTQARGIVYYSPMIVQS